ncbi:hypothetical protein MMC29_006693 [Sticta canariensis]|nr:hypothetical protein [Sticta canariensis]
MPPLSTEAKLPDHGMIWSGRLSKQGLPTILARADSADGVPRNSVHIVIVAMVLGGIIIFVIGLVVIYRLYMKDSDRKELSRQGTRCQSQKKDGIAKAPPAPKTSAQDIWSLNHRNSSSTETALSSSDTTISTVSTNLFDLMPPPLAAPSPMVWNDIRHIAPAGPSPDSLPVYSWPVQSSNPGTYFNVASRKNSSPRLPQTYKMSSRGYSQTAKQSRGDEDKRTGSMSKDFRKGKSISPQQERQHSPSPAFARGGKRESEKRKRNHDFASISMPSIDMDPQRTDGFSMSSRIPVRGNQNRSYSPKSPASPVLSPLDSGYTNGNNHHDFELPGRL